MRTELLWTKVRRTEKCFDRVQTLHDYLNAYRRHKKNFAYNFDMCCSVNFCDNNLLVTKVIITKMHGATHIKVINAQQAKVYTATGT